MVAVIESSFPFSRRRVAVAILAGATLFGLLEASKAMMIASATGRVPPVLGVLRQTMIGWYVWALLAAVVVWMSVRFPVWGDDRRARHIGIHLFAMLVLAALQSVIAATLFFHMASEQWRGDFTLPGFIRMWMTNTLVANVATYAFVSGVVHAASYFQRYTASRLAAEQLERAGVELQRETMAARLDALQKELNPHFLFNSLNALSGLIRQGDTTRSLQMLSRLADLLRVSLSRHLAAEVSLGEELDLLERYLSIEQVRLGDRLHLRLDVQPESRDAMVPTLLLQPLVENAIRYGVASVPGPGTVSLSAGRVNGRLEIVVRNSGPGFPADVLEGKRRGVGLSNTEARLRQLHGDVASLSLRNTLDGQAEIVIALPFRADAALFSIAESRIS